ncbi:G-protein coupled receptor [Biomphalaria glabrata]|nr:G-protein coupled receptor [Biomphalaria glabrata]
MNTVNTTEMTSSVAHLNMNTTGDLDNARQIVTFPPDPPISYFSFEYYFCSEKAESVVQYMYVFVSMSYVHPALSVLGMTANTICLVILRRDGLHKPTNILLFGLVVADNMSLLLQSNYAAIIALFQPNKYLPLLCGFQLDSTLDYFLISSQIVFYFVGMLGCNAGTSLPILITLERLLAIFRPMTFKELVTAKKAMFAVIACFVIWLPWTISYCSYIYIYKFNLPANIDWMTMFFDPPEIFKFLEIYVIEFTQCFGSLLFITSGCIVILIKVKKTLKQRKKLTSIQGQLSWSPRTTRTLLLTCLVFSVTHAVRALIFVFYVPQTYGESLVKSQIGDAVYIINASSNLLIYILSNKKLYHTFKSLFCIKKKENLK